MTSRIGLMSHEDDVLRSPAPAARSDTTEAERSAVRGRRYTETWAVLAVLIVSTAFSLLYFHRAWASPTDSWNTLPGDPQQTMWFLAWVPYAILHGHSSLLSNYQLFPRGENLMWNTSVILPSLLLSPVTLTAGPVVAYNLLLALAPVLTACAAYVAFRRYTNTRLAAGMGALAFAFCPFALHQVGHPQLSLLALMPVTLLLIDEMLIRQHWRWWLTGGLLGVTGAAQLLTGEEILTIEALMFVIGVVSLVALHRHHLKGKAQYAISAAVTAVVVFVALASYPLIVQLHGPLRVNVVHGPSRVVTDLVNFVQPVFNLVTVNFVHQPVRFTGDPTEWAGYLGVPMLLIVALAGARNIRRRPVVPIALVLLLVFALLSLGPSLHVNGHPVAAMPWAGLDHLPALDNILPGRMSVAVDLSACLLFAIFVDDVAAVRRWPVKIAGVVLVAAVVLFWLPTTPPLTRQSIPTFFTSSAKDRLPAQSVAVVTPYIYGPTDEGPVVWQAASGMRFRMVDGWMIVPGGSHWGPTTALAVVLHELEHGAVPMTPQLRAHVRRDLRDERVREVIVGPGPGEPRTLAFFSRLFNRGAELRTGAVEVFDVGGTR